MYKSQWLTHFSLIFSAADYQGLDLQMFGISKRTVSLKEILDEIFFLKSKSLYIESNGKICPPILKNM